MWLRRSLLALVACVAVRLAACDDQSVRITQERRGALTYLYAESANLLEATVTVSVDLQNMRSSPALPVTVDLHGRNRVELAVLEPAAEGKWSFSFRYRWMYGAREAHPDNAVYELPFAAGERHRLIQGYRGSHSHKAGSINEHAHDWQMPEGTPVLAARAGTVVGVRQDSTHGGPGNEFLNCANYVLIRHADGTCGEYLHLQPNGARVRLGETVRAGQLIGLSGNTGYSTAPHLHFAVFRTVDGRNRQSLPVKFHGRDGQVISPLEGKSY